MQISGHFKNILIIVGAGFVAAIIGLLVIFGFLVPADFFIKNIDVENQNQEFLKTSLGIKAYGKLEIFEFLDKALPSVAVIYKKKATMSGLDRFYTERERLGLGFVLTSDGWIVTNKSVIGGWDAKNIVVAVKGKIYSASAPAVYDSRTDVAFFKVSASDLPVVFLGNSDTLSLGDIVFAGRDKNNFWFSYVDAVGFYSPASLKTDLLLSSEGFEKNPRLRDSVPEELNGAMAANRNGEVVGLVVAKGKENYILPVDYFKSVISDVLKNGKIVRPYFGVNYIDLNYALADELPGQKGAYVFGSGAIRAVLPGSPAAKAGIVTGDIILKIDSADVGPQKNLGEIISEYKAGDKVLVKILRGGKELDLEVVLGEK